MSEEGKIIPGPKIAESPEAPVPEKDSDSKVIDFQSHPKVARRGAQEKPPEAVDEDTLLMKMKEAVLIVEARHERSWNRVRELSGTVLPDTKEGEKNFQELRTPRRNLNSQRARINQLRGRIQAAIHAGELTTPDDIVPWHGSTDGQRDEYHTHLALLRRDESKAVMKAYAPLLRQLEQLTDREALEKFLDSMDERTHGIINLLRYVRQAEYDNTLFEQLFDEKKNPSFIKGFLHSERGGESKKSKPSKEKRARKAERAQREGLPGAQMHLVIEDNGARITLEDGIDGWMVTRIHDPKRVITQQEKDTVLGKTFFYDLRDAPEWLRDAVREKGL